MAVQIQFRHDTAANWTSVNPVLAVGEMGVETDNNTFKIGDGETTWSDLGYLALPGAGYDFTWDSVNNSIPESAQLSPTIGSYYTVYGQFGKAFTGGNYVRYYFDFLNYPNAWVEGILQDPANVGTVYESAYIKIHSWGSEFPNFSTSDGTNSKLMLASNGGAGYQYTWNFAAQSYVPDFSDTPYVGDSWYIPGPFGAFKNGDYVRLYIDPWNTGTDAWVEGQLSNMSTADALLTFAKWSDAAIGHPGAVYAGANTTSPYMTLVGKPGVDGDLYSYELPDGYNYGDTYFASSFSYGHTYYLIGNLGTAFKDEDYVRVTFSSGEWLEGLFKNSIVRPDGVDVFVERWSGTLDTQSNPISSVKVVPRVPLEDSIFTGWQYGGDVSFSTTQGAVGQTYTLYGNPELYDMGDIVRFTVNDNNWIEGTITATSPAAMSSSVGYSIGSATISITDWYILDGIASTNNNVFTDYPNASIKKISKPGIGYKYEWSELKHSTLPDLPAEILAASEVSLPGKFNAFANGDYVKLTLNPGDFPLGWVSGVLSNVPTESQPLSYATLTVDSWSTEANGAYSNALYPPLLSLAGKPGINGTDGTDGNNGTDGDTHIIQDLVSDAELSFSSYVTNTNSSYVVSGGAQQVPILEINKLSSTSSVIISFDVDINHEIGVWAS